MIFGRASLRRLFDGPKKAEVAWWVLSVHRQHAARCDGCLFDGFYLRVVTNMGGTIFAARSECFDRLLLVFCWFRECPVMIRLRMMKTIATGVEVGDLTTWPVVSAHRTFRRSALGAREVVWTRLLSMLLLGGLRFFDHSCGLPVRWQSAAGRVMDDQARPGRSWRWVVPDFSSCSVRLDRVHDLRLFLLNDLMRSHAGSPWSMYYLD